MTDDLNEEHIQLLANMMSLIAIVGRIDKEAIGRVMRSMGTTLAAIPETPSVDKGVAQKLLAHIAKEKDEETALQVARDMAFVAKAWQPVFGQFDPNDPYRRLPFAEIIFALVDHSGVLLQDYNAFQRFGGPDIVLPLDQLSAALFPYKLPSPGLTWELIGFTEPADHALVGGTQRTLYLFKSAPSGITLRFSELERNTDEDARREFDVQVEIDMFAAFVAGLLGDMLFWTARLRSDGGHSHTLWQRIQSLINPD